jgi:hypothetical protein
MLHREDKSSAHNPEVFGAAVVCVLLLNHEVVFGVVGTVSSHLALEDGLTDVAEIFVHL